jgi:hypothetical protein
VTGGPSEAESTLEDALRTRLEQLVPGARVSGAAGTSAVDGIASENDLPGSTMLVSLGQRDEVRAMPTHGYQTSRGFGS